MTPTRKTVLLFLLAVAVPLAAYCASRAGEESIESEEGQALLARVKALEDRVDMLETANLLRKH